MGTARKTRGPHIIASLPPAPAPMAGPMRAELAVLPQSGCPGHAWEPQGQAQASGVRGEPETCQWTEN